MGYEEKRAAIMAVRKAEGIVEFEDLVPGQRYRIKLDDCCIEGEITGTFLCREDERGCEYFTAVFDFGRLTTWTGCNAYAA
jgi:hypothetical protein